ncbi:MAG: hypothetical protein K9G40_11795 [Crocinitomicaceae bacterium]|nr:hypothetical protein [Crocinitomicaceae bacterium]
MINSTRLLSLSVFVLSYLSAQSQESKFQKKNARDSVILSYSTLNCNSRSLIVKESILYAANSTGALYAYDLNTGKSTNLMENKKFEEMRDIEFVGDTLYGMQSGSYGVLARLVDAKFESYIVARKNIWYKVFLDGMDFYNNTGFIMGDPVDGFFTLSYSDDGGKNWMPCEGKVAANKGEAGFAASGTNVQVLNDSTFIFVSGGLKSRFFKSTDKGKTWVSTSLPYLTNESSGAFSIHMLNEKEGVIVGGDWANPDMNLNTAFFTNDGGEFWENAEKQPRGYRSCVIQAKNAMYAAGTNGIDISFDKGETWIPFADGNYLALTADDKHLYASMLKGKVRVFELVLRR